MTRSIDSGLSIGCSNAVCGTMEAEGVTRPLINILNDLQTTESLIEKVLVGFFPFFLLHSFHDIFC